MNLLANKIILITGGSRGIGAATVKACALQGATVLFTYKSSATQAEALISEIKAEAPNAVIKAYQSDAASETQAQELINEIVKEFGTIDVLVNNAGITRDTLIMRMSEMQWDEVIDTNLKGVFFYCKAISKPMLRARKGSIINITSIVGITGNAGQANYVASKAGVIGLTKTLALELGSRNIRCNAIAPGFIDTDMTAQLPEEVQQKMFGNIALQRFGKPEEVANAIIFLASDMSSYITGEVIKVSGGL